MVEYLSPLDSVFGSLSDPTRRDIVTKLAALERSVGDLAKEYDMSFAAISKHLMVLQDAGLIVKRKDGRKRIIALSPSGLEGAHTFLEQYRLMWQGRYNKLEAFIKKQK